ncbi:MULTISPECIES: acyl-homoserine-lactone synthase [Paraburkholderia]|jgi:acyl homoserine lactone synthase|uniref:Acyl-homoserine-lactone synthase n=1 Tax=Paraburkholderia tropica TaxID=92647 RepID=A0A1A5XHT6_9BURK|nr:MULTISPECIES: acyl-homoserine-lactone synthase [Paraburkholderia]MBB2981094.1 acyl homoserine lactone synthase [Paraburkholderia tropica]MBB3002087.1 acyl homoserine lactone synthase [Paraburkholderia tropica]MBB6321470.1 acyl homoserine lactone synthase [Paraburkholderia tropica]MBN3808088.1 GNAT family N-acetyltransferase [Paraburkholderia sp. Ac-20347]MDE1138588.1 acyl-homoserine-lactone synthase [Paraburkholderia tropica]
MQAAIRIGLRQEFANEDINEMYRLRARVFRDRMGWDIPTIAGMEIDGYDALGPHYMLIQDDERQVRGCWRLMPTDGPNMLRDTFPQLLHGESAPTGRHIWELSRFAIETGNDQAFGFAELTMHAIQSAIQFADRMGISRYVTVTTTPIERMLRRTGMEITRLGAPMRIGVENAVALDIAMSEQTHNAIFGPMAAAA